MNQKNRKSPRLKNWDYGRDAAYFITICTKDRENFFGEIVNGKMHVSPAGAIAHVLWHEIKNHAKHVELGEFVVMPNHIHGILILDRNGGDFGKNIGRDVAGFGGNVSVDGRNVGVIGRDVACNVPTNYVPTNNNDNVPTNTNTPTNRPTESGMDPLKNERMAAISPKSNTVSSIIRSYKSAVTKYCNRLGLAFAWQSRYHDHIIRNDESFHRIAEYIINNPLNWSDDRFHR
ncbi:transposase [Roseivirga sp. BDSF3-8]|uniref:transposase n=1 Tax=Roseivirga sp. BDSF3-8 TaxID=3241598 RepID=UPI00353228C1